MSPDFAHKVVRWQTAHGRHDLPWQNTQDPYRVWLSEIMLQQTQVATVKDYFSRFVARFADVGALAAASLDEVLGLWSGLGYYSRARNLHRCAQTIVAEHGGRFPRSAALLEQLPGIGRSTAAAVASLCFGERVAILDANVKRVVCRVLGFEEDLARASSVRALWDAASGLLPMEPDARAAMSRYTQGMMDLGATVCLPKKPLCARCPVQEDCKARKGDPHRYPVRTRILRRSSASVWMLWLRTPDGAVWLNQRPTPGIWAGLYCFPLFDSEDGLLRALADNALVQAEPLPPFLHVLTHRDLYLHPWCLTVPSRVPVGGQGRWLGPQEWPALGLPAPVRKLLSGGSL